MKVKLRMPKEYGRKTMFAVWNKYGDPDYIEIPHDCNIKSVIIEYEKEKKNARNSKKNL